MQDPSLTNAKREALSLVKGTLSELDLIDRLVHEAFPNGKIGGKTLDTYRLATHLMLLSPGRESLRRIERSFRNIVPAQYLPGLQLLLGTLVALDPDRHWSNLTDRERIGLETHHPVWWVGYCLRLFGRGKTIRLLSARQRPRYVRVNLLRNRGRTSLPASVKQLEPMLTKVESEPGVFIVKDAPSRLSGFFSKGLFQVQDLASFLAVKAGEPRPGEDVLDVCSAPGGKTATMAQFMKNRGRIIAVDYSLSRMRSWRREVDRLGVRIAEPIVCDATSLGIRDSFDLIVVDPPCTGTGILDRYPSMKWHLTPESVERYSRLQQRILESVSTLLAKEGRIIYCTCSLTLEENEVVVSTFLKAHQEFETQPILESYGSPGMAGLADCRRLWPDRDRTAGYFIARM